MCDQIEKQETSGKQKTTKLPVSEWSQNLLDDMDNGCKDLHEIIANEQAKRKEKQERTTLPVSEWTQNLLDGMDNDGKWLTYFLKKQKGEKVEMPKIHGKKTNG